MEHLKQRRLGAPLVAAMLGMIVGFTSPADAQSGYMSQAANSPLITVVSLNSQRVTVYSSRGKVLEAPVSSGKPGYDTPAGIYSILQKRRDHYSNLYNDAAMPFMQRLTWSGIALHAGDLPGYPASHGCVRMPYDFAAQLFGMSKRGMRVVVVRNDVSPVDVAHPALFKPGPMQLSSDQGQEPGNVHLSSIQGGALEKAVLRPPVTRRSIVATKEAAAEAATKKADEVRRAASRVEREAAAFEEALYEAESTKRRALARIEEADMLTSNSAAYFAREMKDIKAKAQERLVAAQAKIDAVYAEGKAKIDAARAAREEVKAAEAAKTAAVNEALAAVGRPVSVFISRKTQRLYVRQNNVPLFDSAVTISKPNVAIGTTIYTAMGWTSDDAELSWNALSMHGPRGRQRGEPGQTNPDAARAALDRISIPQETLDRISELVTPGSSLIISDEATSRETGEATDFIVLMSGEPQGGTARRRPNFSEPRDDDLGPSLFGGGGGGFSIFPWQ